MDNNIFIPKTVAPAVIDNGIAFIFKNNDILLNKNPDDSPVPLFFEKLDFTPLRQHYLGTLNDKHCFCFEVKQMQLSENLQFVPLRQAYHHLGNIFFSIAGRALHILQWDKNNQFCSRCATTLTMKTDERAKICPNCNLLFYPKLSPAIIVAVTRGRQILLARSPRFPSGNYSVLAGFVEPGETAEETVAREVKEEVGITVGNIQYFGSQYWPFPDSFMLGFTADYVAGEIVIDNHEIIEAKWFDVTHLPPPPFKASIASHLVENFIAKNKPQ